MEEKIKLCGVTHTPFFEMKRAEIFVLSSFYEGFPNVLCEAMHAGMACISTRCKCGPSEIIKNGENGYLVNIGDTLKLAERLKALMQGITCFFLRSSNSLSDTSAFIFAPGISILP